MTKSWLSGIAAALAVALALVIGGVAWASPPGSPRHTATTQNGPLSPTPVSGLTDGASSKLAVTTTKSAGARSTPPRSGTSPQVSAPSTTTIAVQGPDNSLWVYWEASNAKWYGPLGVGKAWTNNATPSLAIGPDGLPTIAVQGPDSSLWVYWEASNAKWYGPLGVGKSGFNYATPSLAIGPNGRPTIAVLGGNSTLLVY